MNVRLSAVRTSRVTRRLQPHDEISMQTCAIRDLFTNSSADCACAAPVAPASATEANSPGRSHADKLTNDSSDIGTADIGPHNHLHPAHILPPRVSM